MFCIISKLNDERLNWSQFEAERHIFGFCYRSAVKGGIILSLPPSFSVCQRDVVRRGLHKYTNKWITRPIIVDFTLSDFKVEFQSKITM